jgi:hypothetical protein
MAAIRPSARQQTTDTYGRNKEMNETVASVESALRRAVADLNAVKARWVLVVHRLDSPGRLFASFLPATDASVRVLSDPLPTPGLGFLPVNALSCTLPSP